jgi:hypothetical protein
MSIINKGSIIKNELYSSILNIVNNMENTISIIKNTYNSRKTLYEKNKKDFENKLANILSST